MKKRFVVFVHLIPAILSLLLIGAHFLREGNVIFPVLSLLLIMALCVREPLVARTAQIALLLASVEWIYVTFTFVSERMTAGAPWLRLVCILGAVTALALFAAALFRSRALKEMYHLSVKPDSNPGNKEAGPARAVADAPQAEQAPKAERHQKLLAVHSLKTTLTSCSLLCFLLMDYSVGLGMVTLIVIGLINFSLRTRMQKIGGILPLADRKKLYFRQTLGLCLLSLPIIGYYAVLLPARTQLLIIGAIIALFTLLLWASARYEYLFLSQRQEG
jgi:hypothetical protein